MSVWKWESVNENIYRGLAGGKESLVLVKTNLDKKKKDLPKRHRFKTNTVLFNYSLNKPMGLLQSQSGNTGLGLPIAPLFLILVYYPSAKCYGT